MVIFPGLCLTFSIADQDLLAFLHRYAQQLYLHSLVPLHSSLGRVLWILSDLMLNAQHLVLLQQNYAKLSPLPEDHFELQFCFWLHPLWILKFHRVFWITFPVQQERLATVLDFLLAFEIVLNCVFLLFLSDTSSH